MRSETDGKNLRMLNKGAKCLRSKNEINFGPGSGQACMALRLDKTQIIPGKEIAFFKL